MRSFWSIFLLAALAPMVTMRADRVPVSLSVISVAPAEASIYVGRLTVTPDLFVRDSTGYKSNLGIDLWPFSYHEDARVAIVVGADALARLEGGQAIEFSGRITRRNGQTRRISGRAVPTSPEAGKLFVRVYLSSQITVSFSTTYRASTLPRPR